MNNLQDTVILDGLKRAEEWPVTLAESLLSDSSSWGPDIRHSFGASLLPDEVLATPPEPERYHDFFTLAYPVNGYNRHDVEWASTQLDAIKEQKAIHDYTTQELLDLVFIVCRGERFSDGLIRSNEQQLRAMIQEVVRRVRSDTPPTFIVPEKIKKDGR